MTPRGTTLRNIRLDDETWRALLAQAEKEGTNASALIRGMVEVYLDGVADDS